MKHEYTTKEVANILGVSDWTVKQYGEKGFIKRNAVKGSGRKGLKYIYTEEDIKACAEKIGIEPNWDASGRTFTPKDPAPQEEPEKITILNEYYVIQFGNFYLTDNMGLNSELSKAKRFAVGGNDSAQQYRDSTNGTLVLIQTVAKEIK